MDPPDETVRELIEPVLDWMARGGDGWQMNIAYWERRRQLLDRGELMGTGEAMRYLSNIDTAMDVYRLDADPESSFEIAEEQLKAEVSQALAGLRGLGYLADSQQG